MTGKNKRFWRIAAVNLALAGVGLIVLELIFGDWFHPHHLARLNIPRDTQARYDATLLYPGGGHVVYTRDKWGLRGQYHSLDDIDIITLGGSATDQRYVVDGSTWQDVIVREFAAEGRKVSVVNAGVDGQSTYGHIKDFDWWFPTLPDFKPRYVLFYIAGNDIFKEDDGAFDDLVNNQAPSLKSNIRDRSAIYRMAVMGRGIYVARNVHKISHRKEPFGSWDWTTKPLVRDHRKLVGRRVERYRKAVTMLARRTRAIGATPIFVTQSLSVYRFRPDGKVEGRARQEPYDAVKVNGVDLYYIMREFWTATMEECAKENGICLDAGNDIRWQDGDFYDAIHNTPQGAERLGTYLHEALKALPIGTTEIAN